MRAVSVTGEVDLLGIRQAQGFLESPAYAGQDFLALRRTPSLAACGVAISSSRNALANRPRPQTETVKALANVDNNAHDLSVVVVLESLPDSSQQKVEPEIIDRNALALLTGVGPLAAVLVLWIFPFRTDALFEEVVIGLDR